MLMAIGIPATLFFFVKQRSFFFGPLLALIYLMLFAVASRSALAIALLLTLLSLVAAGGSAKQIGGFLALRDPELATRCRNLLVITEGFPTYGGLAGRDLEAIGIGLHEVLDEHYLQYRIRSIEYLGDKLIAAGVPIMQPAGGHAVYLDAKAFLPQIPVDQYPGQALVGELYIAGGIRSVEIGSLMFGKYDAKGILVPAAHELVRLAIPRRVYTQSHIDYVAEVIIEVCRHREKITGLRILEEAPVLRHFTAKLTPITKK